MKDTDALEATLISIAMPLLALDHASLYLVTATPARVHLHLGGAYAGCPGNVFVERSLLRPLVLDVYPNATVEVTSGPRLPEGAKQLHAKARIARG